ncbi:hypothetical protein [Saccharopolyspora gloriosae]|uniref:hypothetical protein n=1 Tax=Saccharopolyspora gloriosae TaxID=455344 RepID=UPI001FB82D12|nr:hypothetical protein [Saccharopolyspora gloriosae]
MPEQVPGPVRVRDLSVEAHGSTVLILHGDGDEPERRVFQGIPVAPGDGLVLASSIAVRTNSFRSALRQACRMALTAAAKQRVDASAKPRLWLAVSGLGRTDGRGKTTAQKLAREFTAEVYAPDGPLTFVAGGSIFAGVDHHRWMCFVEGGPGEFHSARYPQPEWETQLPRGEVADGGLQTRPVPAGLAVSADDVLSHSVAVSAWHPRLVLGTPGGPLIAPHQVAALLRRFPKPLLDRIQLVPADPRTASSQWLRKLAELVEHDVVSATGLVRHDTRTEFVYIADEAGNPVWQPFPAMLRYSPTGTTAPVLAGPPPRGWTPGPLVYRWSGAPSPRPVPQEIVAKVVPSGLTLLPAADLGKPGAADRLAFESHRFTVSLGWPCAPVPEGTQVALYRLLAGLAPEQLARLRVLVLGVADERMRSEILSAAGEWAPRVSFPSVLTAPLVSPQHARARGYGSEAEAEAAAAEAAGTSGGAIRRASGADAKSGAAGSASAPVAGGVAESAEISGEPTAPEGTGAEQGATGSGAETSAAGAGQAVNGSAPAVPPAPNTVSASDPVSSATVRLSRSLIQTAVASVAAADTAVPTQVPATSSATFAKAQRTPVGASPVSGGASAASGTTGRGAADAVVVAGGDAAAPGASVEKSANRAAVTGATATASAQAAETTGAAAPATADNGAITNGVPTSATTPGSATNQAQAARPREALPKREPGASPLSRESAKRRAAAAARLAAAQERAQHATSAGAAPEPAAKPAEREAALNSDSPKTAAAPVGETEVAPEPVAVERKTPESEAASAATVATSPAGDDGSAPVAREQGDGGPHSATAAEPAAAASAEAAEPVARDTSGRSTDSADPGTVRLPHLGAAASTVAPSTPAAEPTTAVPARPPTPPKAPPVPPAPPRTSSAMPVTSSGPVGESQPAPNRPAPPDPVEQAAPPAAPKPETAPVPPDLNATANATAHADEEAPSQADGEQPAESAGPAWIRAEARPEFGPDHQSTEAQRTAFAHLLGDAYEAALPSVNTALATFPALREEQLKEAKSDFVAVHVYLGDDDFGATAVNEALQRGDRTELGDYQACLLSGLRRLPVHRGPVFRLLDAAALDAYEVGMLLTEPAFLSASSEPRIAAPQNSKQRTEVIAWSQSSRRASAFHRNGLVDEVVFPAGSRFRVLAVDRAVPAEPSALLLRELRADEEPGCGELTETDRALLPRLRRALDRRRRAESLELDGDAFNRLTAPVGLVPNG